MTAQRVAGIVLERVQTLSLIGKEINAVGMAAGGLALIARYGNAIPFEQWDALLESDGRIRRRETKAKEVP